MNVRLGVGYRNMGTAGPEGDSSSHGRSPWLRAEELSAIQGPGQ